MKPVPVPIPGGLVETQAARYRARFGEWPRGFQEWCMRYCRGVIPQRVLDMVEVLKRDRPWEIPEDPPPGYVRITKGDLSFTCPLSEILPCPPK